MKDINIHLSSLANSRWYKYKEKYHRFILTVENYRDRETLKKQPDGKKNKIMCLKKLI